jgi:hypothetical protein
MKTWQQLPKEIKKKMLKRQFQQYGYKGKKYFNDLNSAFVFIDTKEGHVFWYEVINGNFDLFYQRYPKKQESSTQRLGKLFEQWGKASTNFQLKTKMEKETQAPQLSQDAVSG